jgi:hypothetical protein
MSNTTKVIKVNVIDVLLELKNTQIELYDIKNNIYYCNLCYNYSTPYKWSIQRHITSHKKEFSHKCTKCNYKSNEMCHLNRHKRSFNH